MVLTVELLERLAHDLEGETTLRVVTNTTHKKYCLAMERAMSRRVTGSAAWPA